MYWQPMWDAPSGKVVVVRDKGKRVSLAKHDPQTGRWYAFVSGCVAHDSTGNPIVVQPTAWATFGTGMVVTEQPRRQFEDRPCDWVAWLKTADSVRIMVQIGYQASEDQARALVASMTDGSDIVDGSEPEVVETFTPPTPIEDDE